MIGRVIAKKLEKSVTVLIERQSMHPLYKKTFVRSKKYLVDDPIGVKEGDVVEIIKIAPVSKRKQFRVMKVLGKQLAEIMEEKLKKEAEEVIEEVMPAEKKEESNESKKSEESKAVKSKKKKGKENGTA